MKHDYIITAEEQKYRKPKRTVHLVANGKRVCQCRIQGLEQEAVEMSELPEDVPLCETSARKLAVDLNRLAAWNGERK